MSFRLNLRRHIVAYRRRLRRRSRRRCISTVRHDSTGGSAAQVDDKSAESEHRKYASNDENDEGRINDTDRWMVSVCLIANQRQQRQLNRVALIKPFRFERELVGGDSKLARGEKVNVQVKDRPKSIDPLMIAPADESQLRSGVFEDTIEFTMQLWSTEEANMVNVAADPMVTRQSGSEPVTTSQIAPVDKDAFGSDPVTVDVSD